MEKNDYQTHSQGLESALVDERTPSHGPEVRKHPREKKDSTRRHEPCRQQAVRQKRPQQGKTILRISRGRSRSQGLAQALRPSKTRWGGHASAKKTTRKGGQRRGETHRPKIMTRYGYVITKDRAFALFYAERKDEKRKSQHAGRVITPRSVFLVFTRKKKQETKTESQHVAKKKKKKKTALTGPTACALGLARQHYGTTRRAHDLRATGCLRSSTPPGTKT